MVDMVMHFGHLAFLPRKVSEIINPVPQDGQVNWKLLFIVRAAFAEKLAANVLIRTESTPIESPRPCFSGYYEIGLRLTTS